MTVRIGAPAALLIAAVLLGACAGSSSTDVQTSAIPAVPKVDPMCSQLAAQIDVLRNEGVASKVENAAARKYKMKPADLSKAAQLNKANEDFQSRCSNHPIAPRAAAGVPQKQPAVAAAGAAKAGTLAGAVRAPAEKTPAQVQRAADAAAARAAVKAGGAAGGPTNGD